MTSETHDRLAGITTLELDADQLITKVTSVYDSRHLSRWERARPKRDLGHPGTTRTTALWCGCLVHAVPAAWLGHPRLMNLGGSTQRAGMSRHRNIPGTQESSGNTETPGAAAGPYPAAGD